MTVDYRRQYTPEQLEPLWPNGMSRLTISALCTPAIMIVLAVLPVVLEYYGMGHWVEEADPANPQATPENIRPEWYFLAVYQSLKLFPNEFLDLSGKTLAVVTIAAVMLAVVLLPFWLRRNADRGPGVMHGVCVTAAVCVFIVFTLWAAWPAPPLLTLTVCAVVVLFYVLLASERRRIRRIFHGERNVTR